MELIQSARSPHLPDLDYWLEERERVLTRCLIDATFREAFIQECKEDPVFWMNYTAWAFDPRKGHEAESPFILWDFQENILVPKVTNALWQALQNYLFRENIVIDKARDMGGSFCILYVFQWFWQFHGSSFIIGSRKEEEVDKIGDMDTPFEKLRYNIRRQPEFLLPAGFDIDSKKHNKERLLSLKPSGQGGPQIVGESANENFGRGGRALAALCDEFQKWQFDDESWRSLSGTVKVRIALGTPDGPFNKFARMVMGQDGEKVNHIRLYWYYHPERMEGLEERNGHMWSPWLQMMKENNDAETMAKEYLLDYNTSTKGVIFQDQFNESVHCDPELEIRSDLPVLRICDPGVLGFAWLWAQISEDGEILFHKELIMGSSMPNQGDANLEQVMTNFMEISNTMFDGLEFEQSIGDPGGGGAHRAAAGHVDADYVIMQRDWGIKVHSDWLARVLSTQREEMRITTLKKKLQERIWDGSPAVKINSKNCKILIEAFKGGYRRQVDSNGEVLATVDRRHPWCDVMDCAGMAAVYKFLIQTGKVSALTVKKQEKKWKSGRNQYG